MSKKQKYINELIKILYKAQAEDNMDYPENEISSFEKNIGAPALHETFEDLRNIAWTKINSTLCGNGENIQIVVARPFLTIEAVEYAEYLFKNPIERFFIDLKRRKINWTVIGLVLTGGGLMLNALINLDKLEANYNKYFSNKKVTTTSFQSKIKNNKINPTY